jgi:hypothetical protein
MVERGESMDGGMLCCCSLSLSLLHSIQSTQMRTESGQTKHSTPLCSGQSSSGLAQFTIHQRHSAFRENFFCGNEISFLRAIRFYLYKTVSFSFIFFPSE